MQSGPTTLHCFRKGPGHVLFYVPAFTWVQIGGDFEEVSGDSLDNAALVDATDLENVVSPWNPDPDDTLNAVQHFEDDEDNRRYMVGGAFEEVDADSHEHFAVLDSVGELLPDSADADDAVHAIDFHATSGRFAVGGEFGEFDGEPREGLAMLDLDGEELDTQETSVAIDGVVLGLSQDEDHVAVAGTFQNVDGEYHAGIVLLDAETLEPVW